MRIYFNTTATPKKAVKRVYDLLGTDYPEAPFKHSDCLELTAKMLGYESWHQLDSVTKEARHSRSPLDEDCTPEEQLARLKFQAEQLREHAISDSHSIELAAIARVSAGDPKSNRLNNNGQKSNSFEHFPGNDLIGPHWTFKPSLRSITTFSFIADHQLDSPGILEALEFMKYLEAQLKMRPEDIYLIEEYLRLSLNAGYLERVIHHLDKFSKELKAAMPDDFLGAPVEYSTRRNRPFLRASFWLGVCFYHDGRYRQAKHWLSLIKSISDEFSSDCDIFLADINSGNPTGSVTL